jgi:hypothetical protein
MFGIIMAVITLTLLFIPSLGRKLIKVEA